MKKLKKKSVSPLVFRQWKSRGYSVFSSLKKTIKIGCLAVTYLLFANPENVSAQVDPNAVTKNYDLESIDVNSSQLPDAYSNISRVVVTISKAEIERAAITSVTDLLEYAANIDIRQRGAEGMQADISIRGGSFDQVLILLNGVNTSDPQTGHHNLNLPFELSSVERIEILKGPGSWKFGPGAFSGAINIITTNAQKKNLSAQLELGQFGLNKQNLSAGVKLKNSSHLLSASRSSTDGYTKNTDHKLKNVFYHGSLQALKGEFSVQAGATDKAFGANSFYSAKYPNQYEEIQTYFLSADYSAKLKNIQITPRVYYRRNNDRFLLFRDNPSLYSNYHTTDVYGSNILTNIIHGNNATTSMGIDIRSETIFSNNLGEISGSPIFSPVNDTIVLNRYHSRTNYSVFAGHKHYFEKLMVNIGVNLTHNTDLENDWFLFPGLDLNYSLNDQSSIFASANKTMRMPTYTDLYYKGPSNEGNPKLLPEEAVGYELGYKLQNIYIDGSVTGFVIRGTNLIDWVKANSADIWHTVNYTELNTSGVEFAFKTNLKMLLSEQNFLKEFKVNYTWMDQNKIETEQISNYTLNYLKNRLDFDLGLSVLKSLGASIHLAYQDRFGEYLKYENNAAVGSVEYVPFTIVDLKLFWIKKGWKIYASVNNVFDKTYFDYGNVPQPGRWVKFGISKKIEFN